MTVEVYMIKWAGVPFLFSSLAAAKEAIAKSYPDHMVVGSGSDGGTHTFEVCQNGKIQDRVVVMETGVHNEGIELPSTAGRSTAEF